MSTAPVVAEEPKPPVEAVVPEPAKIFKAVREIQLVDEAGNRIPGSQKYEAEGTTQAEADQKLMDKMAETVLQGTRRIRELNLKVKSGGIDAPKMPEGADIEEPLPDPKPKELTADELFQINQDLKDPAKMREAYRKLYTAETGMEPLDDAKTRVRSARDSRTSRERAESQAFIDATPDYYVHPENGKALAQYLGARNMAVTQRNLAIAFKELTIDGLLVSAPEPPEPPVETLVEPPVEPVVEPPEPPRTEARVDSTVRQPDRFPSAIRPSQASGADTKPKPKGPSAKEFAMMSADKKREFLTSRGLWGKNLPSDLFAHR